MENAIESFTQGSDSFLSKLQDFQFFLYTYSLKVHCLGASGLSLYPSLNAWEGGGEVGGPLSWRRGGEVEGEEGMGSGGGL